MKILHLSSSYPYTDLYKNLLQELDEKNVKQIMYVTTKNKFIENKREIKNPKNTNYIFSSTFNNLDRYIYYSKIRKVYKDIKSKVDLTQVDLVHSHFLFSDGSIAYKLKQELGIDYIVAVRNADVNFFFKYGFHIRNYGINTLKKAKKIIFLSPAYKEKVISKYVPEKFRDEIEKKSYIVPNGIDFFWLENVNCNKVEKKELKHVNLISVGELNKNKNIINSIRAALILLEKGYKVNFRIVGEGPLEKEISDLIDSTNNHDNFKMHGYIADKEKLLDLYRSSDIFLMPSFYETFGLVYIEAMSQGLPVIYSKGQGIDGYFENGEIGYSVDPGSPEEIAEKIENILGNYNEMLPKTLNITKGFNWGNIADQYIKLYKSILDV